MFTFMYYVHPAYNLVEEVLERVHHEYLVKCTCITVFDSKCLYIVDMLFFGGIMKEERKFYEQQCETNVVFCDFLFLWTDGVNQLKQP